MYISVTSKIFNLLAYKFEYRYIATFFFILKFTYPNYILTLWLQFAIHKYHIHLSHNKQARFVHKKYILLGHLMEGSN